MTQCLTCVKANFERLEALAFNCYRFALYFTKASVNLVYDILEDLTVIMRNGKLQTCHKSCQLEELVNTELSIKFVLGSQSTLYRGIIVKRGVLIASIVHITVLFIEFQPNLNITNI